MTRRIILIGIVLLLGVFWIGLFYVVPWYWAVGALLAFITIFGVLIRGELRGDIDRPSGEEMADAPDLWDLPPRCLEAPDTYDERRAA